MTDPGLEPEELRALLRAAVATRPTSPRAFGEIQQRYRHRRRTRRVSLGVLTAAVLAGGGFAVASLLPGPASSSLKIVSGGSPSPSAEVSPSATVGGSPAPLVSPPAGPVTGFRPESASFVSAQAGWALGYADCGGRTCTELMATQDGGRTWSFVSNPPFPVQAPGKVTPGDAVSVIRFASPEIGWAYGPALWVTRNGGATWVRDTTFGSRTDQAVSQVVSLETAGGTVYAVVHAGEGNGCTNLYANPVPDENWAKVAGVGGCGAGLGGTSLTLYGSSGWLLLNNAGWAYYRLANGVWQAQPFPCAALTGNPDGIGSAAVAAASPALVALECTSSGAAGSSEKVTYLSTDGGVGFRQIAKGVSPGSEVLLAMNASRLLVATASGASWIYGLPTTGGTPTTLLQLNNGGAGWHDLGLTTPDQGFVIEGATSPGTAMYMTRDGGNTWTVASF